MRFALDGKAETTLAFVLRCALASTFAYELASWIGLKQPLWAAMSSVIVAQEQINDTRSSIATRVAGTIAGALIAVAVGLIASRLPAWTGAEIAAGVAIAAYAAHKAPKLRVAMWTCPVVLLTAEAGEPIQLVALRRASEVLLGVAVAWAFHWLASRFLDPAKTEP